MCVVEDYSGLISALFCGMQEMKKKNFSRENARKFFMVNCLWRYFLLFVYVQADEVLFSNIRSRSNFKSIKSFFFAGFFFSKNLFHSEEVIWMTTETFFSSGMFKSAAPSNLVGSYRSKTCQGISEVRANLEKNKKFSLQYNSIFFV